MSGTDMTAAQSAGSNASEFVRKLHRMLEDPTHQDVARWSKDGDTFLVVEGEKFTRSILPKHFKHSNMSSFIRQLNKYDFHKVKPTTDSDGNSLSNVLEFKHPFFRRDSKDDLDNIRRKAPASRNKQVADDYTSTNQHINIISEQLAATQQQVQQLQELYTDVSHSNKVLINEVLQLQRIIKAQKQASHEIVNYLTPYDGQSGVMGAQPVANSGPAQSNDDSAAELQRARELLSSVPTETITDRELERLQNVYGSPADSNTIVTPSSMPLVDGNPMHDIARYPIYPVGQTVGIDPFHSDHIHKIPYAVPNDAGGVMPEPQVTQPSATGPPGPDKNGESMWGAKKPRILLVEDDPTCTKIGIKFLKTMGCEVEHASNGAEAFQRMSNLQNRDYFDMIFMDIIMPMLDGVSATLYIRQNFPAIPVIAMTSNIRPEEVNGYFEHGMNGVLAKPFTKDGMYKSVRTHLGHLMKNPPPESDLTSGGGYFMGSTYLNPTATLKYEAQTPPANNSTWSPGLGPGPMGGGGMEGYGFLNGSNQYTMATGHRPNYSQTMQSANSSAGHLSDVDSPPEKRQRLNPNY